MQRRHQDQPQARTAFNAENGHHRDLSKAEHLETQCRTHNLSVPAQRSVDHARQPGLVRGYYLYPMAKGFVYLVAIMDL